MIQIIPAIDLIEGHCVRLTQGDYSQKKIYNENPLEVAKSFEDAGITRLHLVDLDGAKQKRIINHKVLELLATKTNLHIDFGGGVQSDEMIDDSLLFCSVQIHQMKTSNTCIFKRFGNFQRIFVVGFFLGIISLCQTHAMSVNKVNGWDNLYHLVSESKERLSICPCYNSQ